MLTGGRIYRTTRLGVRKEGKFRDLESEGFLGFLLDNWV